MGGKGSKPNQHKKRHRDVHPTKQDISPEYGIRKHVDNHVPGQDTPSHIRSENYPEERDVILAFHHDVHVAKHFIRSSNLKTLLTDLDIDDTQDERPYSKYDKMLLLRGNIRKDEASENFEDTVSMLWCDWLRSIPPSVPIVIEDEQDERWSTYFCRSQRGNRELHYDNIAEEQSRDVWLEIKQREHRNGGTRVDASSLSKSYLLSRYSGGSLATPSKFCDHWTVHCSPCGTSFTFDNEKEMFVIRSDMHDLQYSCMFLRIPYDSVENKVVVNRGTHSLRLILSIKRNPFLALQKKTENTITEEIRQVNLEGLGVRRFGRISAVFLEFRLSARTCRSLISCLQDNGKQIVYSHVDVCSKHDRLSAVDQIIPTDFDTFYAWRCLTSKGPKVTDSISLHINVISNLLLINQKKLTAELFYEMALAAESDIIFDFETVFESCIHELEQEDTPGLPSSKNKNTYGRVIITPTDVIPQQPEQVELNRVLRKYTKHQFLRVSLRDEDFSKLVEGSSGSLDPVLSRMRSILQEGLTFGKTQFDFLGSSNSQLRDHGFWFCTTVEGETAETIRDSLGDLSKEKCIAKYVARLGLCFSSTSATVDTSRNNCTVEYIKDTENNDFCFTDGIGMISVPLADEIGTALDLKVTPSAFQVRYGGCKGVLAKNPFLGDKNHLIIRKSMKKFDSPSSFIETMAHTRPGQLYLNRQIITLMSGLGVPDEVFLKLQENVLSQLANMFVFEDVAIKMLEKNLHMESRENAAACMKFKRMYEKGVTFTDDALFENLLTLIYKYKLSDLMSKSRIDIPTDEGRILMGTVDETKLLKYGQVYIQYSVDTNKPQEQTKVVTGKVVIGKNPCFHPGDLRVFDAVDVIKLSHMVDCVVFPQDGPRPHPDEMSGSDLDGDMYHVCWNPDFIPPNCNQKAMDFTGAAPKTVDRKITVDDITEFIVDYMKCNMVGRIANRHVVFADIEDDGIFSEKCLDLAKLHSDAVDFPKTGVLPIMGKEFKVDKYPHFMQKKDKDKYTSKKIIGKLFDECENSENVHLKLDETAGSIVNFDDDFRCSKGYECFLGEAKKMKLDFDRQLRDIMTFYGVETEAEAISGKLIRLRKGQGYVPVDKNDKIEMGSLVKEKVLSLRKKTRASFFEEFGGEDVALQNADLAQIRAKASSWYIVTYNLKRRPDFFSFAWATIGDILAEVKANQISEQHNIDSATSPSLLRLGSSIVDDMELYVKDWLLFNSKFASITDSKVLKTLQFTRSILDKNSDVIPTFLFVWFWASKNGIANKRPPSIFKEAQFPLLLLQVMENLEMLNDVSRESSELDRICQSFETTDFKQYALLTASNILKILESFEVIKNKQDNEYEFYDPVVDGSNRLRIAESKQRKLKRRMKTAQHEFARRKTVKNSLMNCTDTCSQEFLPPKNRCMLFDGTKPFMCENILEWFGVHLTLQEKKGYQKDAPVALVIQGSSFDTHIVLNQLKRLSHSRLMYRRIEDPTVRIKNSIGITFSSYGEDTRYKVIFEGTSLTFLPQATKRNRHINELSLGQQKEHVQKSVQSCFSALKSDYQYCFHGDVVVTFTCGKVLFERQNYIKNNMNQAELRKALNETWEEGKRQTENQQRDERGNVGKSNRILHQMTPVMIDEDVVQTIIKELFGEMVSQTEYKSQELLLEYGQMLKLDQSGNIVGLQCPSVLWASHDFIHKEAPGCDVRMEVISLRQGTPCSLCYNSELKSLNSSNIQLEILHDLDHECLLIAGDFRDKVQRVVKKRECIYFPKDRKGNASLELVVQSLKFFNKFADGIMTFDTEERHWEIRMSMNANCEEIDQVDFKHDEISKISQIILYLQSAVKQH